MFLPDGSDEGRRGTDLSRGMLRKVAVYAPTETSVTPGVYAGGVYIEGTPEYDPPREVLGASPFQVLAVAFDVVRRFVDAHPYAFYVDQGPVGS